MKKLFVRIDEFCNRVAETIGTERLMGFALLLIFFFAVWRLSGETPPAVAATVGVWTLRGGLRFSVLDRDFELKEMLVPLSAAVIGVLISLI